MVDVGDWSQPQLVVYPYDETTAATLTVKAPSGNTTPTLAAPTTVSIVVDEVTVTAQKWTTSTALQYTVAGWWVFDWDTTGMGAGNQEQRVFVEPAQVAGGPTWTPSRERVAQYILNRTISVDDESGTPLRTFTDATTPSGDEADRTIADAVAWVLTKTGDLAVVPQTSEATAQRLADMGRACAALRAAGLIELSFPDRDADVNTAQQLLAQADSMRTDLAAANEAETGDDPVDPGSNLLPVWSFPTPASHGDLNL